MALFPKINTRASTTETTGFGTNNAMYGGGRLVNKNGRPNIHKKGVGYFEQLSWYHTLILMPRWKFLLFVFLYFLSINLVFASTYFFIGVEHLNGMDAVTTGEKFIEAYFFSAQTFTTVGYGRINPTGYVTSFVAALEAFTGLLFFALATGLFYARFSRAQSFLKFSTNMLVAPYRDGLGLMCRVVSFKNNLLTDAEVKVTVAMVQEENGQRVNKFYPLKLEIDKINALTLSWTLVHAINEESPFYQLTQDDLINYRAEVLVYVKAFDETYSNTVIGRTSYTAGEFIFNAKFEPMFHRSQDNTSTVMQLDKLNSIILTGKNTDITK